MEFLIVLFPWRRGVRVDDTPQGWTNTVLQLEAGQHDVTLEPPMNYSPILQRVLLENTSPLDPYRIGFHQLPASAIRPSPGRPA
jgi:hypothetical protein